MIKRITIALLLLVLSTSLFAQRVPKDLPKSYVKEYKQNRKALKSIKGFDVVLDPVEVTDMAPSMSAGQAEILNWGNLNLAITANADKIKSKLKRPVWVYVFDTAGDFKHKMLSKSSKPGFSFTGEPSKEDGNGHGTHVAGIYGAWNQSQQLGIARYLAEKGLLNIVPVKVLSDQGSGLYSWMTTAVYKMIEDAKKHPDAFIIFNFSLSGSSGSAAFDIALAEAKKAGIAVVCAAGNSGKKELGYPARSLHTDAISASGTNNTKASFSNYGEGISFIAPGVAINSTWKNGTVRALSGTSMSTPTQGAIYAILASVNPEATAAQIRAHMIKYTTDLPPTGYDENNGHGLSVITRMLENSINPSDPPENPEEEPEDPEDLPTKNTRYIVSDIPTKYKVLWRAKDDGKWQELIIKLSVRMKTNLYAEDAIKALNVATLKHFVRRYYIIPETGDFIDAGFTVRRFYEILLEDQGLAVDVIDIRVENEDGYQARAVNIPRIGARKIKKLMKASDSGYLAPGQKSPY